MDWDNCKGVININTKEFKIHLMRGIMRPEYFYIPILYKEKRTGIYIEIFDENGEHFNINNLSIHYNTYSFYHLIQRNDDGSYSTIIDETYKGYVFEEDTEWRYEVPNPSQWEILPLPDFTQNPPEIDGGTIKSVSEQDVTISFSERYLIELKNIPAGVYQISFNSDNVYGTSYYPDYYNDYQSPHYVSHDYGNCMVDRNGKFSGFNYYTLSHPQYGFPNGYDFYCISQKFVNNTMPIVVTRRHNIRFVVFMADVPFYSGVMFSKNRNDFCFSCWHPEFSPDAFMHSYEIVKTQELFTVGKVPAVKIYIDNEYKGYITSEFSIRYSQNSTITSVETDPYNNVISTQSIINDKIGIKPLLNESVVLRHSGTTASNGDLDVILDDSEVNFNSTLTNRYNRYYTWDDFVYIIEEEKKYEKSIASASFNSTTMLISLTENVDYNIDYYESINHPYYHSSYITPGDHNNLKDSYVRTEGVNTPLPADIISGYVEIWDEHSIDNVVPKTIEELPIMVDGAYTNVVRHYVYMEGFSAEEYANYIKQALYSQVTVEIE